MKADFPLHTLKKLAKKNGVIRISKEAIEEVKMTLLEVVEEKTKKASIFANHAGRMTIKKDDVELAIGE